MKKKILILTILLMLLTNAAQAATISLSRDSTYNETVVENSNVHYSVYKIMDATKNSDGTAVAYFIKTGNPWYQTIHNTGKFSFVTLVDGSGYNAVVQGEITDANAFVSSLAASLMEDLPYLNLTGEYAAQNLVPDEILTVDDGYYLIVSDLGENLVLATTDIQIAEKNEYPKVEKAVAEEDEYSQIGKQVMFTLSFTVPNGADKEIVLKDTMSSGLTFDSISNVYNDKNEGVSYTASSVDSFDNSFTVSFNEIVIKENQGNTIYVEYFALLNGNAVTTETNNVKLDYSNIYETKPVEVEVHTDEFKVLKYDGADAEKNPLAGAIFQLSDANGVLPLVKMDDNVYRLASTEDNETTDTFVTNGVDMITIQGVDRDITYYLDEVKAPDGYNLMATHFEISIPSSYQLKVEVPNNQGVELPSTGGTGAEPYIASGGAIAIIAAAILIARKKSEN